MHLPEYLQTLSLPNTWEFWVIAVILFYIMIIVLDKTITKTKRVFGPLFRVLRFFRSIKANIAFIASIIALYNIIK